MIICYEFVIDEQTHLKYEVNLDRHHQAELKRTDLADWTRLEHCQCSNCPLNKQEHERCPAAIDIQNVVHDFKQLPAFQKADVIVTSAEREYHKRAGIEEGLRSLMGLILATSACPLLGKNRPMAVHHLPFASTEEFILRAVTSYLLQQYFAHRDSGEADWELKGLVERNKQLQLVNQALWQRIHDACEGDSNLKALLSFFSMASSVSFSLESQLQRIKTSFIEPSMEDFLPTP